MVLIPSHFVATFDPITNVIKTEVKVAKGFDPDIDPHHPLIDFTAIWDTGATCSVISQKVVDACGLKPIGMTRVQGVNSVSLSEVFLVNIRLLHGMGIPHVRVTKGDLGDVDVLIGMDIIKHGDFAVYPKDGKTFFTFRFPAKGNLDFKGTIASAPDVMPKIGRNAPCPCGSGKKYKRCCG